MKSVRWLHHKPGRDLKLRCSRCGKLAWSMLVVEAAHSFVSSFFLCRPCARAIGSAAEKTVPL